MRFLILFLTFSTLTFAQNQQSKNVSPNKFPCTIEMTVEQLTSKDLHFQCEAAFDNQVFKIQNFKMKIERHKTFQVYGTYLYLKSKTAAKKLKIGDIVQIFDIEKIIIGERSFSNYNILTIRIKE